MIKASPNFDLKKHVIHFKLPFSKIFWSAKLSETQSETRQEFIFKTTNIKLSQKTNPSSILFMNFRGCVNHSKFGLLWRRWKIRIEGWQKHFPDVISPQNVIKIPEFKRKEFDSVEKLSIIHVCVDMFFFV